MKIQVSYQGVTVSVEGDDVTLEMLSLLYDQLKAKLDTVRFDARLDGDALRVAIQRDGYKEYIPGLNGEQIEVVSKPQSKPVQHETLAEKGIVNSPDKSPFQPNTMHLVDAASQIRSVVNNSLVQGGYVNAPGGIL